MWLDMFLDYLKNRTWKRGWPYLFAVIRMVRLSICFKEIFLKGWVCEKSDWGLVKGLNLKFMLLYTKQFSSVALGSFCCGLDIRIEIKQPPPASPIFSWALCVSGLAGGLCDFLGSCSHTLQGCAGRRLSLLTFDVKDWPDSNIEDISLLSSNWAYSISKKNFISMRSTSYSKFKEVNLQIMLPFI